MGVLDKIIGWISPSWGLQREMARQTLASVQARAYEAAAYGRRTNNWRASSASATTEASTAIGKLRDRSREMVRNNSWANRAIAVIANNTIGTGIRPAISVSSKNKKTETRIKEAWNAWADGTGCDFDGRLNFYGLQKLIMRAVAECGECLIVKDIDAANQRLQLRILEGDFIDTTKHSSGSFMGDGDFDFYGIRFNAKGKRIGVWLFERHPEFGNLGSTLYSEDQVIHVYEVLRAGQARGVPMGVSGFLRLRDMNDYEDAQLIRQKVAACFSVFVQQNSTTMPTTTDDDRFERVEPGMVNYLSPGEQVTFGNPPPVEGYESYTRQVLRGIASAYGITYEALTNDLSNVNFSSGRMGWIGFQQNIAGWQRDIMQPTLEKVFGWFIQIFGLSQRLTDKVIAEWTAPRREMIDPSKETNAMVAQIRAGLKSYPEAMRELGYDPEDTLGEVKTFYDAIDVLGLKLTTDLRVDLQPDIPTSDVTEK
jgi:lambda family phage portal protein